MMNSNTLLRLNYEQDEVVSAQRMRLLHSSRLKWMVVMCILGTIAFSLQQGWLWYKAGVLPATWYTPIYFPVIFFVVIAFAYFLAPAIDFKINHDWRNVFDLYLEGEGLRITAIGQAQGIEKAWNKVKRVLEGDKVYVLFFDAEQDFIILPKRVLKAQIGFVQGKLTPQAKI